MILFPRQSSLFAQSYRKPPKRSPLSQSAFFAAGLISQARVFSTIYDRLKDILFTPASPKRWGALLGLLLAILWLVWFFKNLI